LNAEQPAPNARGVPRFRLRAVALTLLVGLAAYLCFRVLEPFISVLLGAGVLAVLFAPMRERLTARTGSRNFAAGLTLTVAILVVLLPVGLVTYAVIEELAGLLGEAPQQVDELLSRPDVRLRTAEILRQARDRFPFLRSIDRETLADSFGPLGQALVEQSFSLVGAVLRTGLRFVLIAFTLFFFLRDGELLRRRILDLLPLDAKHGERLLGRIDEVLRATTYGVVVVAALQGVLGGAMFAVLGLPSPLLWGVAMALLGLLPMLGTAIVWLPAALLLFAAGETVKALLVLGWGALVVGTIDNLVRPMLVGRRARLSELVVFFGVMGGIPVFGLVGLLVGPAIFAVASTLFSFAREINALEPDPVGVRDG
jgi:predicted PurR-regulated permease PerM